MAPRRWQDNCNLALTERLWPGRDTVAAANSGVRVRGSLRPYRLDRHGPARTHCSESGGSSRPVTIVSVRHAGVGRLAGPPGRPGRGGAPGRPTVARFRPNREHPARVWQSPQSPTASTDSMHMEDTCKLPGLRPGRPCPPGPGSGGHGTVRPTGHRRAPVRTQ